MTAPAADRVREEDPAERQQFDCACGIMGQTQLERIAQTLELWGCMAPSHGSYGKLCIII